MRVALARVLRRLADRFDGRDPSADLRQALERMAAPPVEPEPDPPLICPCGADAFPGYAFCAPHYMAVLRSATLQPARN